jgi:hypothetical protein
MAIIYTYPTITPTSADKVLVSVDGTNATANATISSIKETMDVVDNLTATLPIEVSNPTGNITISSRTYAGGSTTGHVPTGGTASTFLKGDGSWGLPLGILPAGGDQFSVLVTGTDYDVEWDYADKVTLEVRFDEAVSKGDPLHITGFNLGQNRICVNKADAADPNKMPAIGDNYALNDNGQATTIGSLKDVNTQIAPNDFQEGDVLYVKAGGGLTNVKPTGTNLIQNVGKVGRRQQNNGEIVVMAIGRLPNIPQGNIWLGDASGVASALPIGNNETVLTSDGTTASWETPKISAGTKTATSLGKAGELSFDSLYMYVCIATNQWRRIQLDFIP